MPLELSQVLQSMPTSIRKFKQAFKYLRTQGVNVEDAAAKKAVRKYVKKQRRRMDRERRLIEQQVIQKYEQNAFKRCGQLGSIAETLLLIKNSSSLAKEIERGFYADKNHYLRVLCKLLSKDSCGFTWGWRHCSDQQVPEILYLDLPQGQVSFHSQERLSGPDYCGEWDGNHASERRIFDFCHSVLNDRFDHPPDDHTPQPEDR